ncbi:MAG: rRNA maturation RNase YbeY [Chloroflexi bacterium]|nr:rRNA maturation RNase YbeY [Chloroflexota bacterium]
MRAADETGAPLSLDLRFHVRRKSGARPDRPTIRRACEAALRGEGIEGPVVLTITLVDDAEIQALNAEHRQIDRPTDVLSFPLADERAADFVLPPGLPRELGDVVVSYPQAVAQAEEYGHSVARELTYLIVHGLLHILGHDHEQPDEQMTMRAREEAAMTAVNLSRAEPASYGPAPDDAPHAEPRHLD